MPVIQPATGQQDIQMSRPGSSQAGPSPMAPADVEMPEAPPQSDHLLGIRDDQSGTIGLRRSKRKLDQARQQIEKWQRISYFQ